METDPEELRAFSVVRTREAVWANIRLSLDDYTSKGLQSLRLHRLDPPG